MQPRPFSSEPDPIKESVGRAYGGWRPERAMNEESNYGFLKG
jgi:hypothetical protein